MRPRQLSAVLVAYLLLAMLPVPVHAGIWDDLNRAIGSAGKSAVGLDEGTIAKGLKEALAIGTERAVKSVSQRGGYFNNSMIKILVPERLRRATDLLAKFGFQAQVDEFVLSMNRAAEKAAPMATEYFVGAIREMSFDDARRLLKGGDTAATEYFKEKTGGKIHLAFKPVVQSSMQEVGVARSYSRMVRQLKAIPFGTAAVGQLDLDEYVTTKAVDGLFLMLGEEEKRIRRDPAARATELLRKVFGRGR